MIELSVALPIYRGKHIVWLAIESLCRQKNIDFKWELIVIEERFECFSEEELMKYSSRLEKIGCCRISYTQLEKWIPLSKKWKLIGEKISDTSKAYLLQAADCYSQPYRLVETHSIIVKQNYDYVSTQIGPFYDIPTGRLVVYDMREHPRVKGLNMAIKPHFIRSLPEIDKKRGVNGFIIKCCRKLGEKFRNTYNHSENWKYGVDTNGLNNISGGRLKWMKKHKNFNRAIKISIDEILPQDVAEKLKNCQKYCRREYI